MEIGTSIGKLAQTSPILSVAIYTPTFCRCSVFTARSLFSVESGIRLTDDQ